MVEKSKSNCSTCSNCYATIALCVSFLAIGMIIGNCIGKCQSNQKCYKSKKCSQYSGDGQSGSTCNWTKESKKCKSDCTKECCAKK